MFNDSALFVAHELDGVSKLYVGKLPSHLSFSQAEFDDLWAMHPQEYHEIRMPGGLVKTPRWQQAFGADYHYTGRVNKAVPIPPILEPVFTWTKETVDDRLNGMLLNWYDAKFGHYIGKHRDSTTNMVEGSPIVTLSLGEERVFRLRPWKGTGYRDFPATSGTLFVMPYDTNMAWTHEVPHFEKYQACRISITLRAFETNVLSQS
jgi:alkylated DNA repair dioxygenase AlkB